MPWAQDPRLLEPPVFRGSCQHCSRVCSWGQLAVGLLLLMQTCEVETFPSEESERQLRQVDGKCRACSAFRQHISARAAGVDSRSVMTLAQLRRFEDVTVELFALPEEVSSVLRSGGDVGQTAVSLRTR